MATNPSMVVTTPPESPSDYTVGAEELRDPEFLASMIVTRDHQISELREQEKARSEYIERLEAELYSLKETVRVLSELVGKQESRSKEISDLVQRLEVVLSYHN